MLFYIETYELDWRRAREIGLKDVMAPEDYVLTEFHLYVDKRKNGEKQLQLGALAHIMDFQSGKLGKSFVYLYDSQLVDGSES